MNIFWGMIKLWIFLGIITKGSFITFRGFFQSQGTELEYFFGVANPDNYFFW